MDKKTEKSALYIRVSTRFQIDKDSLPFQRKELINYSKYLLGIDNYEVFEDAGFSGKDTDRPAYQDMMNRTRAGEFTHILVWKIDRISRNLTDFSEMYDEIKEYGITFISKNEQFDTSSAMGEAMLKIILVFAELERKLTAERVYSIMLSRAEKGLWNGANVPLGYKWSGKDKFPIVCDIEAHTVREIYNSYEKVKSCAEVKRHLELAELKTKRDGTWTTKTIGDVLRNPFYVGTYRYNYRYTPHGKIRPPEEWIVREDNHEAIISKDQYDRVNAILDSNANMRSGLSRTLVTRVHVFRGLIRCGKCDKNYAGATDRPRSCGYRPSTYRCFNYAQSKKAYRTCRGMIGEVKLGPFVINYIANLIKASDFIDVYGSKGTEKELEKILLKGPAFEDVVGIVPEDLETTRNMLLKNTGHISFDQTTEKEKDISEDLKLENYKQEKKKIERGLTRLQDLYLFSDDSMAEKDYLIKKQEMEQRRDLLNEQVRERSVECSKNLPGHDLGFIKKATQYLLAQSMTSNKPIDYNTIVKITDKQLLQDLMQAVIRRITVEENKQISSIEFVNGITHRFVYRV